MSAEALKLDPNEEMLAELERQLNDIISNTRPLAKTLPGYDAGDNRHDMDLDCDEVYPNIFLSDGATAKKKEYLKRIGVTHIINAAKGKKFGMVNTSSDFYKDVGIKFLGLELLDLPIANISCHFRDVADFIEEALESKGKVLVHCLMGISRSSTCVLAYLILKKKYRLTEALRLLRQSRDVRPNYGFLRQLAYLDNQTNKTAVIGV